MAGCGLRRPLGHESALGLHEPLSFDWLQEPMKKQRLQEHQIRAVVKRLLEGLEIGKPG
jgi:hypothetical protein